MYTVCKVRTVCTTSYSCHGYQSTNVISLTTNTCVCMHKSCMNLYTHTPITTHPVSMKTTAHSTKSLCSLLMAPAPTLRTTSACELYSVSSSAVQTRIRTTCPLSVVNTYRIEILKLIALTWSHCLLQLSTGFFSGSTCIATESGY